MWHTCRFWLARSQLPGKDQIQTFPSSPDTGRGQELMRCLGEAGPGLGKALQDTDCLGMVLLQPSLGHWSRARIRAGMCRRDRSRPGRGAPGVGSHLSHPCALRVPPRLPRALISALRSPRSRARVLAKPWNGHSSPAGKISTVWVGWDAGGTFPTPCWEGA